AATQWEMAEEAAELVKPARDELLCQAAQDGVLHNDDTGMRVLKLKRPEGDERTGVFTSGIVSVGEGRTIALFFTGREHAGENLATILKQRAADCRRQSRCVMRCRETFQNCPQAWRFCWRTVSLMEGGSLPMSLRTFPLNAVM